LIDVGDYFIDLGEIAHLIRKDPVHTGEYEIPQFVPAGQFDEEERGGQR
jgi:hypothetical protein